MARLAGEFFNLVWLRLRLPPALHASPRFKEQGPRGLAGRDMLTVMEVHHVVRHFLSLSRLGWSESCAPFSSHPVFRCCLLPPTGGIGWRTTIGTRLDSCQTPIRSQSTRPLPIHFPLSIHFKSYLGQSHNLGSNTCLPCSLACPLHRLAHPRSDLYWALLPPSPAAPYLFVPARCARYSKRLRNHKELDRKRKKKKRELPVPPEPAVRFLLQH